MTGRLSPRHARAAVAAKRGSPAPRPTSHLLIVLSGIGAAALAIFIAVLFTRPDRGDLWNEAGKAALQVLTVAVLGAVLKLLTDHYKEEQERLAQDAKFRQDKYDRLVEATNALRRVPILIQADSSVTTFDAQLREVVEAGLRLRMIKHQIWSSKEVPDPPFPDHRQLTYLFESLYHYTDWLTEELIKAKVPLLEAQRRAADADLAPDQRESAAEQIRDWVPTADAIAEMRERPTREARKKCQTEVTQQLGAIPPTGAIPEPDGPWSWLRYEETEGLALASITAATLQRGRTRQAADLKSDDPDPDGAIEPE